MNRAVFWNGESCVKVVMIRVLAEQNPTEVAKAWYEANGETFAYTEVDVEDFDYGNIDVSRTCKQMCESLLRAIEWLNQNGFSGVITVDNTTKTEFKLTKNGVEDTLTLTSAMKNPQKINILDYMKLFNKSFEMKCEIERLKALRDSQKGE